MSPDGVFEVDMTLPEDYPMVPPRCCFVTPCYHPGIKVGVEQALCIDILHDKWSPACQITTVVCSIRGLLLFINQADVSDMWENSEAARHFATDYDGACDTARQWTLQHATPRFKPTKSAASENRATKGASAVASCAGSQ